MLNHSLNINYSHTIRLLFILAVLVLALPSSTLSSEKRSEDKGGRVLLAIFAHPDDEVSISPVLAKYAREGFVVYLAIATDGRLGMNKYTAIPTGDSLASVRKEELKCAAEKLGIKPPIIFGLHDQFRMNEGLIELSNQLDSLRREVKKLFIELKPDVVITWNSSGWSGHHDHRMVFSVVTEIFESQKWGQPSQLYYAAIPTSNQLPDIQMSTVDPSYLSVRVPVKKEDYDKAKISMLCHNSQYTPEIVAQIRQMETASNGTAYFRPFIPVMEEKNTLF